MYTPSFQPLMNDFPIELLVTCTVVIIIIIIITHTWHVVCTFVCLLLIRSSDLFKHQYNNNIIMVY